MAQLLASTDYSEASGHLAYFSVNIKYEGKREQVKTFKIQSYKCSDVDILQKR